MCGGNIWLACVIPVHICPGVLWLICDLACLWQVWKESL